MFAMVGGLFSKDDMEEFMNEADKDGNGKIDYEEFIRMLKQFDQSHESRLPSKVYMISFQ